MDWVELLTRARERAGLSQRGLARRAGVPPSTVHRIESRRLSPTVDMLDRLLSATGSDVVAHLLPTVDSVASRKDLNESERRSLAFGTLVARRLLTDPASTLGRARTNLQTMQAAASPASEPYLATWAELLAGSTADLLAVLTGDDQRARDLRQSTPFAGVVPDPERLAVIRILRAA